MEKVDSFDDLLFSLEKTLLESMLYMQQRASRVLMISDEWLDDCCNLRVHFLLDVQWKDVEGVFRHEVVNGMATIDYGKHTVRFSDTTTMPFDFEDNYYRTRSISATAEQIAERILSRYE